MVELGEELSFGIVMNGLADVNFLITTDVEEVASLSVGVKGSLKSHFNVGDTWRREQIRVNRIAR